MAIPVAVFPDTRADMFDECQRAVERGGGTIAPLEEARGLVFADPGRPDLLRPAVDAHPHLEWVQLPFAGIEDFLNDLDTDRVWLNGKDVYSEPVAEHVLAMALCGFRHLHQYAQATAWTAQHGRNLLGANVTILGGGGITRSLLRLLQPWGCSITVVRRTGDPLDGAHRVLTPQRLPEALAGADLVVVALALTPATEGMLDAAAFAAMPNHAWVVNVARGRHIVTADLLAALDNGDIAGAALDVTDPEPLPDNHPLWRQPNVIITPHLGNTREMGLPLLADRIEENVRRFCAGEPFVGVVDPARGY